jgi:hypothetical protein
MNIARYTAFLAIIACGGSSGGRPVVIPEVPAGAFEADCQKLCARATGESICTAKHAEFCVARCRAVTRDLPAACASCVIAAGRAIKGDVDMLTKDSYCLVGGPADLTSCTAACDDGGAGAPDPNLETLCQLECSFHMQDPKPLACSAQGSADCLTACHATIAARRRICAQCLIEQTNPVRSCINDECDCTPMFRDTTTLGCAKLCD